MIEGLLEAQRCSCPLVYFAQELREWNLVVPSERNHCVATGIADLARLNRRNVCGGEAGRSGDCAERNPARTTQRAQARR